MMGFVVMVHRVQPAPGDLISQRVVAVLLEPLDRHPLERRPAVRLIPLLPGFIFGGENTARREQTGFNGIGQPFSLLMRRHAHIQRHNAGRREQRQGFTPPVVITITAVLFVPQIAVYRRAPVAGFLAEQISRLFIPFDAEILAIALSSLNRNAFKSMGINCVVRMLASRAGSRSQRDE